MRYLLQGMETRPTIDALLAFTKITSGPKIEAVYYHLIGGAQLGRAAAAYSVSQSKLSEAITTLNEMAGYAEKFHELRVHEPENMEHLKERVKAMQELNEPMEDIVDRILQLTTGERV